MMIKLPGNESILMMLATAQTLGFAYAGLMYESGNNSPAMMVLAGARGLLLGAALSFGTAVAAQRVPRVQSKRARSLGFIALGGLLVISPVIMAPAIFVAMPAAMHKVMSALGLWGVAISLAVAPDLVAVAVATQSGALQATETTVKAVSEPVGADKAGAGETKAKKKAPEAKFVCKVCGRICKTQNELNGHGGAHKRIALDKSLLLRREGE